MNGVTDAGTHLVIFDPRRAQQEATERTRALARLETGLDALAASLNQGLAWSDGLDRVAITATSAPTQRLRSSCQSRVQLVRVKSGHRPSPPPVKPPSGAQIGVQSDAISALN